MGKDKKLYRITLQPIGAVVEAEAGTPLRDLLFEQGVEFPCGGQGRCRGCKVRVLQGNVSVNAAQREHLSQEELEHGWRLACQSRLEDDLVIELRQWDATILVNDAAFAFTPEEGLGVAVDVGTTTVVAQLLDLEKGYVLGVKTALNPQARYGADVMSRVNYAVAEGGAERLTSLIRHEVGRLIHQLFVSSQSDPRRLRKVTLVGNTVMHHLFCGIDLEPLSHTPFEPVNDGMQVFRAQQLGWVSPQDAPGIERDAGGDAWGLPPDVEVRFLPCLGGFVGSDLLAGILATGMHQSDELCVLMDLGTNGEILLGNREHILCASTAAGPAFEGARISMGMRAATGAIWKVVATDHRLEVQVLGNAQPRGICGSGLVDAVAAGLQLRLIRPTGRFADGAHSLTLAGDVALSQADIRQLQLAKGAIAAGVRILLHRQGVAMEDVRRVYLAGAFGNYVDRHSARRIGLLGFQPDVVQPVGNTALLGAKMALFAPKDEDYASIRRICEHVSLNEDPAFQDVYVEEMTFPAIVEE
ncbi:MAG: ASKHA domain-containing protein [Chthonomonadales bacterium]